MSRDVRDPFVLVVDDSATDARATRRALGRSGAAARIEWCRSGEEALELLRSAGTRPDLVLLDLHLGGVGGRDVLAAIKGDPYLRSTPVVVLTASVDPEDACWCYDRGANAFVRKPVEAEAYARVVERVVGTWLEMAVRAGGEAG